MRPPRRHFPMTKARQQEMDKEAEANARFTDTMANVLGFECWICGSFEHNDEQCPKRVKETELARQLRASLEKRK